MNVSVGSEEILFVQKMCGAASVNNLSLLILFTLHREFSIKSGTDCSVYEIVKCHVAAESSTVNIAFSKRAP